MFRHLGLALILAFVPGLASAWFDGDWSSRKSVAVDASLTGADIRETVADFPLLIRLHAGNFNFFAELAENGKDLRFMLDDKAPLKFAVEKLDASSQLALIWVRLPQVRGGASADSFWMYYGNSAAAYGSDPQGVYDARQSLVFHFAEGETTPRDATAYGNHAIASGSKPDPSGMIGTAAGFDGSGKIEVKPAPSLEIDPEKGWTFNAWIRIDAANQDGMILQALDGPGRVEVVAKGASVMARYLGPANEESKTPAVALQPGQWRHLALVVEKDGLDLYLDGQIAAKSAIHLGAMKPAVFFGGNSAEGQHFVGSMDEVQISGKARSPDWIKLSYRSQSPDFMTLGFGEDESEDASGEGVNYFAIILQNLTVDGWIVIGLCGAMLLVSLLVMGSKSLDIARARKSNQAFLDYYAIAEGLDFFAQQSGDGMKQDEGSPAESSGALDPARFRESPLYRIHLAGARELEKRAAAESVLILTPQALNVLRTRLSAVAAREGQKLGKNMVLLTLAISGGPFLGLLGTVLGVMITFAVISATGDVNINSIAPGISGALLATVAGLAVAIPSLFAYNYLMVRIKEINTDMRIFIDEYLASVEERYAEPSRSLPPPTAYSHPQAPSTPLSPEGETRRE